MDIVYHTIAEKLCRWNQIGESKAPYINLPKYNLKILPKYTYGAFKSVICYDI